ncbi:hypothetical protein ABZ876_31375 [Streptomyces sp. NPDC046931]
MNRFAKEARRCRLARFSRSRPFSDAFRICQDAEDEAAEEEMGEAVAV